jgi:hypothetical protein
VNVDSDNVLSPGLRIAPPEAPVSGYMFGKGVYFADMFSKVQTIAVLQKHLGPESCFCVRSFCCHVSSELYSCIF